MTLLLILGVSVGPMALGGVPDTTGAWFPFIGDLALVMVVILLGDELTGRLLRDHGRGRAGPVPARPEIRDVILAATVGGILVFEVAGPVLTRWVVAEAGEGVSP